MVNEKERVAIVTGGAMGIGGACARRLARDGARVLVVDIEEESAAENVSRIREEGGEAVFMVADVAESETARAMVEKAVELWGRLDILVNNAWGAHEPDGSAVTLSESAWAHGLDVGVRSHYLSAKYGIPHMEAVGGGNIINISSAHGLLVSPGSLRYETVKAAVIAVTRQMAVDFGPLGVRVNAICPGHIVTERSQANRWDRNPSLLRFFEEQYPVRRLGHVDEIAGVVAFLCSSDASFVTGQAIAVDGGLTLQLQENLGMHLARYIKEHPDTDLTL